jgi:hypothetical protein
MPAPIMQAGNYKNLTATGQISSGSKGGTLIGFYVNSTSSGTVALFDGAAAGTAMCGTITPAIGFHPFPAGYGAGGLFVTIGGTLNVTFFYQPSS